MRSLFKKSERVHTAQMARARQLRSYSRDCFAPSQESSGEHHAYDLVYLQNVDLGKFATRARAISPSLGVPVLQLNKTTKLLKASLQPNTATQRGTANTHYAWSDTLQLSVWCWWHSNIQCQRISLPFLALQVNCIQSRSTLPKHRWRGSVRLNPRFMQINVNITSFNSWAHVITLFGPRQWQKKKLEETGRRWLEVGKKSNCYQLNTNRI